MGIRLVLVVVTVLTAGSAAARGLPLRVELDGCVEPASGCRARDVVTLNAGDRKLSFAVERLRVLSTTHATSGGLLAEMRRRPVRVTGPEDLVGRLTPGARLRVRALLRMHERYMMLQGVDSRPGQGPDDTHSGGQPAGSPPYQ